MGHGQGQMAPAGQSIGAWLDSLDAGAGRRCVAGGGPRQSAATTSVTVPGMRFAISIPQYVRDAAFDPAAFRAHLARAEELGFESAWTQEQVLGSAGAVRP